jgi:hypothetical protein
MERLNGDRSKAQENVSESSSARIDMRAGEYSFRLVSVGSHADIRPMCRQDNEYRANVLVNAHANRTLTVPTFQAAFGSYRMRHLHVLANVSSRETGHDPAPRAPARLA